MNRLFATALAVFFAWPVAVSADAMNPKKLDTFTLTQVDKHTAILTYHNSASMNSLRHAPSMTGEGFTVDLDLQIGEDEVLTVTPSPGWIAIPEVISVPDGDTGKVKIVEFVGF